jgi:hypothetical protein
MKREWKQVEVTGENFIPFEWKDRTPGGKNLGRAEFQVCINWRRGEIAEFWVYPVQTRLDTAWHYTGGSTYFSVNAYEGLKSEGAWMVHWCNEHKCQALKIYAPSQARFLQINHSGISFWISDFSKPAQSAQRGEG